MTDAFALLSEPRRPWLDPEALKSRVLPMLAASHPDRVHGGSEEQRRTAHERHAALNEAWNLLREPRDRLLHLYELEAGQRPRDIQRIPPGTMDLFVEVGQTCRDLDAFLKRKSEATSPMVRVAMMEEGFRWLDTLQALQARVHERREALASELQALNPLWESAPPVGSPERRALLPLDRLETLYRAVSYVARWTGQLQERMVGLST